MDAYPNIHKNKDVMNSWQSRPPVLREAVATYLWCPIASAAIERSFSLAGLVDVNNRQSMGKDLREACVTMFCSTPPPKCVVLGFVSCGCPSEAKAMHKEHFCTTETPQKITEISRKCHGKSRTIAENHGRGFPCQSRK